MSSPPGNNSPNRLVRWLRIALAGLAVAAAWGATERGVDYLNYQAWTRPILNADASTLGSPESMSPYGLPYFHWSAGPALLAAPVSWAMREATYRAYAELVVGFACVLAFWWFFYEGLRELAGRSAAQCGCLLAMTATSLGYYSLNVSSEAMTIAPAGALFLESARWVRGKAVRPWLVVAATCLLAILRPQQAAYAWPALAAWALSEWPSLRAAPARTALRLAPWGMLFILTLWQIGTVNRWMTGSFWRTPYSFGDEGFRSFDSSCPHLAEVLFDPFHGFFPSTPVVVLGVLAALATLYSPLSGQRSARTKFILIVASAAVAANAYVHGCWYYWWLAAGFGMRGMALSNIYVVAAIAVALRGMAAWARRSTGVQSVEWIVTLLAVACALWSWTLARGESPTDWPSTWRVFSKEAAHWIPPERWPALGAGIALGALTCLVVRPQRGPTALAVFITACLVWIHLVERAIASPGEPLIVWGLFAAAALSAWLDVERQWDVWPRLLALATVTTLVAFVPIAWRAESVRKPFPKHPTTFNAVDFWVGYQTASKIPRMEAQAKQMREFLLRQKGAAWIKEWEKQQERP